MKKDDGRRPMKGFEKYYELTRGGMVYSVRLKRFIKHKVVDMTGPYIELRGKSYDEVKPVVLEDPEVQVSDLNTSAFLSAIMAETKKTAD